MTRPKPPEAHTRKLRELLAADLLRLSVGHPEHEWLSLWLNIKWLASCPLPYGSVALYLRLRGITAPGARPALSAALHGRRVCPPGADYAPPGWAAFIEEEAAKADKE